MFSQSILFAALSFVAFSQAADVTPNAGPNGPFTGGVATYYYQGGAAGACGHVNPDSALICAIAKERFGNMGNQSPLCGRQVKITNTSNKKTVQVTVADQCPGCKNSNSIDLSVGAFEKIASLNDGVVPIEWSFV